MAQGYSGEDIRGVRCIQKGPDPIYSLSHSLAAALDPHCRLRVFGTGVISPPGPTPFTRALCGVNSQQR